MRYGLGDRSMRQRPRTGVRHPTEMSPDQFCCLRAEPKTGHAVNDRGERFTVDTAVYPVFDTQADAVAFARAESEATHGRYEYWVLDATGADRWFLPGTAPLLGPSRGRGWLRRLLGWR